MPRGRHKWKVGYPDWGGPARPPEHMDRYLRRLAYPARTAYLVQQARLGRLPNDVVRTLRRLSDRYFISPQEAEQAVQELSQLPAH